MEFRLGSLLVDRGVLDEAQVRAILDEQARTGEPFGAICERLFDVEPRLVEEAWATQYARRTRTVDPLEEPVDPRALVLVTRRQAWQFRVLPLRWDGREVMMVTTPAHIGRALGFAHRVIGVPVYFVMAEDERLGEALCRHHPLPGMTSRSILDGSMDRLLAMLSSP